MRCQTLYCGPVTIESSIVDELSLAIGMFLLQFKCSLGSNDSTNDTLVYEKKSTPTFFFFECGWSPLLAVVHTCRMAHDVRKCNVDTVLLFHPGLRGIRRLPVLGQVVARLLGFFVDAEEVKVVERVEQKKAPKTCGL